MKPDLCTPQAREDDDFATIRDDPRFAQIGGAAT